MLWVGLDSVGPNLVQPQWKMRFLRKLKMAVPLWDITSRENIQIKNLHLCSQQHH